MKNQLASALANRRANRKEFKGRWPGPGGLDRVRVPGVTGMTAVLLLVLASILVAQPTAAPGPVVRVLRDYDGDFHEPIQGYGTLTPVHDPRFVRDGLGSLEVAPAPKRRYWGVTFSRVDARSVRALLADLYHTGSKPAWLLVKVEDVPTRDQKNRFSRRVDVKPGWNRIEVNLEGARTENGDRRLDFSKPLHRIVIDRGGPKDAFYIDHVRLLVNPPASPRAFRRATLQRFRGKDEEDRVKAVHDLGRLPEAERVPLLLGLLKPSEPAWIQQALVDELVASQLEASWKRIVKRARTGRKAPGYRMLELLGRSRFALARDEARKIAADPQAEPGARVVAFRSAARQGRADLVLAAAGLAAQGPAGARPPWSVVAAAVWALRQSRAPEAVGVLIDLLAGTSNARVQLDAYEALVDLTGKDYGYELIQWKGWWAQNKDKPLPPPDSKRDASTVRGGYATFYGIPVRGTRIVFILDVSGSMREELKGKRVLEHLERSDYLKGKKVRTRLELAQEELVHTLEQLPPETCYNVGFFNDEVFWLHKEMVHARPQQVGETARRIRRMTAQQKTNVYEALRQSLEAAWSRERTGHEAGPDTVFLLSDGMPSTGRITRHALLADWLYQTNLPRFVRINAVLVGKGGQWMLRRFTRESSGVFTDVGG